MNEREKSLYEKAKNDLDLLYRDVDEIHAEFKDLISQMAAQILADEKSA